MKSFLSLPTNGEFFARYANLVPTLFKVGVLSQIISAVTEIGIIFTIAYGSLKGFFPHYFISEITAGIAAFIGTGVIEIGLRKFVPYSVKAFLYKRFKGLDLAMSIFILFTTSGLLLVSGNLSFRNSPKIIETIKPVVKQKDTEQATAEYDKERNEILTNYRTDSSSISSGFIAQINTKNIEYQSLIDVENKGVEKYERKEERTGKSYRTKKILIKTKIAQLQATRDEKIGILTTGQATELKALLVAKNAALVDAKNTYKSKVDKVTKYNDKQTNKSESEIKSYGFGLGWFTIFCLTIFVLSVILDEIHKKGSGIKEQVLPSQYDFSTGIVGDFFTMLSNKVQQRLRAKIHQWESKTPPPSLPVAPTSLYNLSELKQEIITVKFEEDDNAKIIYLPNDNRSNDNRYQNDTNGTAKLRECKNCGDEYIYKHHKQMYCKESCRIEAWEQRTGGKVKKRKVK